MRGGWRSLLGGWVSSRGWSGVVSGGEMGGGMSEGMDSVVVKHSEA